MKKVFLFSILIFVSFSTFSQEYFTSKENTFKAKFPSKPLRTIGKNKTQAGKVNLIQYIFFESLRATYWVVSSEYPSAYIQDNAPHVVLEGAKQDGLERIKSSVVSEQKNELDSYEGLFFKAKGKKLYSVSQLYLKGNTVFQIFILRKDREPTENEIDTFIKSFKFIDNDETSPQIVITYPDISRGFKPVEKNSEITITGKVTDKNGIYEVLINDEQAIVDGEGNFSKTFLLGYGNNPFTVRATDLKKNIATKTFTVERRSGQQDLVVVDNPPSIKVGKYYALIIGNNNYGDPAINSLDEPINDATKLFKVLTSKYSFEPENIIFLKNASYVQMIEAFDELSNTVTENDNLLVFYAGHGWWDDDKELGYWLPTDAKTKSTAFWIANSRISDYMGSIDSKHTLLIADACFSGSIFKTRAAFSDAGQAINTLYDLPSRSAMTSGNLKEVPDKSVFLEYLVKRLDNNSKKYLSADQLFSSFRIAVMNNSKTEPQFGTIQNAGDEGGEFIFIRRD